jgi:phage gp36-like protein
MAYATEADLFQVFGRVNVRKWADVNNSKDGTEIDTRIEWALESASTELNERLRMSVYQFPLEAEPFPELVVLVTCWLAGLRLYESRGLIDSSDAEGFGRRLEKRVDKFVYDIIHRRVVLDVAVSDLPIETSDVPFTVSYDDDIVEY